MDVQVELRLGARIVRRPQHPPVASGAVPLLWGDFAEGVRAIIIDKDHKPNWRPSSLSDVTDAHLDLFFRPFQQSEATAELNLSSAASRL